MPPLDRCWPSRTGTRSIVVDPIVLGEGTGPRWHEDLGAAAGGRFVVRHPTGY
jgi:hypothetical protein